MKKPELLSPAGDFKSLEMAIQAGADAVYIALKSYGARAFAPNFSNEEVISAIKLCHLYGVRLYVAMNTLIKDCEVKDFLKQVEILYLNGVDAVIMQDLGMICLVREKYPELEIHASTQFNNSGKNTLLFLKKLGVKRAVLSRELSLDEIKSLDVDIEKEVFIHGALCISYSGCCLFSSMIGHRSGNRGECTGCCRLPYTLEQDNKVIDEGYLLSTKELNTTRKVRELIKSGIHSFKIEGRMKSSTYVYFITKFYRNLIDNYDKVDIDQEEEKLKILFNRKFTEGHLFNVSNRDILNTTSSNHMGKRIGKVVEIKKDKIKIKLDYPLKQEDGIRFLESKKGLIVNFLYDDKMKLTSRSDNYCYVDNKVNLTSLDTVYLTSSKALEKEILDYEKRRVGITFNIYAHVNEPLRLIVSDGTNSISEEGIVVEKALNSATSKERVLQQLTRVKDTIYRVDNIDADIDTDIFIPIKNINEMRRVILCKLNEIRCKKLERKINEVTFSKLDITPTSGKTILVNNEEELLLALTKDYKRIYITKSAIFCKYKDRYSNIYYSGRRNLLEVKFLERNLVHDICQPEGAFDVSDYTFNVFNSYTVYYLHKYGYKTVTLSAELSLEEIINLQKSFINNFKFVPNLEVIAKARVQLMTIKGDIFKCHDKVLLVDHKKRKFPILYDRGMTYIYNYEVVDKLSLYQERLKNINFRIDTTFL